MITKALFFGGSKKLALLATRNLDPQSDRVQIYTPLGAHRDVMLPAPTAKGFFRAGGPHFYILNLSGTYNLVVKYLISTIVTLAPGEAGILLIAENAAGSRIWYPIVFPTISS